MKILRWMTVKCNQFWHQFSQLSLGLIIALLGITLGMSVASAETTYVSPIKGIDLPIDVNKLSKGESFGKSDGPIQGVISDYYNTGITLNNKAFKGKTIQAVIGGNVITAGKATGSLTNLGYIIVIKNGNYNFVYSGKDLKPKVNEGDTVVDRQEIATKAKGALNLGITNKNVTQAFKAKEDGGWVDPISVLNGTKTLALKQVNVIGKGDDDDDSASNESSASTGDAKVVKTYNPYESKVYRRKTLGATDSIGMLGADKIAKLSAIADVSVAKGKIIMWALGGVLIGFLSIALLWYYVMPSYDGAFANKVDKFFNTDRERTAKNTITMTLMTVLSLTLIGIILSGMYMYPVVGLLNLINGFL